jgi:hypothetical protein
MSIIYSKEETKPSLMATTHNTSYDYTQPEHTTSNTKIQTLTKISTNAKRRTINTTAEETIPAVTTTNLQKCANLLTQITTPQKQRPTSTTGSVEETIPTPTATHSG